MKRGGRPQPIGAFLPAALRRLGIADRVREHTGLRAWRDVVGETIARRTQTIGIRDGILWVEVDGSTWMQELSARRGEIVAKLAERVGHGVIRDIRFVMDGAGDGMPPGSGAPSR